MINFLRKLFKSDDTDDYFSTAKRVERAVQSRDPSRCLDLLMYFADTRTQDDLTQEQITALLKVVVDFQEFSSRNLKCLEKRGFI